MIKQRRNLPADKDFDLCREVAGGGCDIVGSPDRTETRAPQRDRLAGRSGLPQGVDGLVVGGNVILQYAWPEAPAVHGESAEAIVDHRGRGGIAETLPSGAFDGMILIETPEKVTGKGNALTWRPSERAPKNQQSTDVTEHGTF